MRSEEPIRPHSTEQGRAATVHGRSHTTLYGPARAGVLHRLQRRCYKQRLERHSRPYQGRLAAMRWPERELVFDGENPTPLPRTQI